MDEVAPSVDSWHRFWNVDNHSLIGSIKMSDAIWVEDALCDTSASARREVALQAWINIWAMKGMRRAQLSAMRNSLSGDQNLVRILDERTKKTDGARRRSYAVEAKRFQDKQAAEERRRLSNWKKWRNALKRAPAEHFGNNRVGGTVHNLFHWMNEREAGSSSHCVWDFRSLVSAFGQAVADSAKNAFMKQWRSTRPELWSERLESNRSSTPYVWIYGLSGLMAEAETPGWATALTSDEAKLAARYATIEINRLAPFITELARVRPNEVESVLGAELDAELENGGTHSHLPLLQDLTHADIALKELVKPRLMSFLTKRRSFKVSGEQNYWYHTLDEVFGILSETVSDTEAKRVGDVCIKQLKKAPLDSLPMIWLRGVFRFIPDQAADLFVSWFKQSRSSRGKSLALKAIADLFGDWRGIGVNIVDHDRRATALGKLIRVAYKIVRPEDDAKHEGAYSPDARDTAERGRSSLLSALLETPGEAAQKLLIKLSHERDFGHFPDRLRQLAIERAAKDAEFEAWTASSVSIMDKSHELPPRGRDEIFQLMIDRLEDLQHDLYHDDFSDRRTLQTIIHEAEMQRSIAQRFKAMARDAYTLDREPEVAEAKRPDVRLRSNADGTKAAIEIKIADNEWTLKDLEKALRTQLVGQYLRHESCRVGCLLLTFNGKRKRWPTATGRRLTSVELVTHLNRLAQKIETKRNREVRVVVFGLYLNEKLPAREFRRPLPVCVLGKDVR